MGSRGMQLGGDLDNLAYASQDEFEAVLKKFCATKNCKPDSAMRWALQRSLTPEQQKFIETKLEAYYASGAGLI